MAGGQRALLLLVAVLLAVELLALNLGEALVNHDVALCLQCGAMILEGKLPYVDFVETNPPLILYLSTLPVLLAKLLGSSPTLATNLLVVAVTAATLAPMVHILRRGWPEQANWAVPAVALSWAAFPLLANYHVGQREHLFWVLAIPWLLARAMRWSTGRHLGLGLAIALGLAAGIGASLKPHFWLLLTLAELCGLVSSRRWRALLQPELLAALLVPLIYLALLALPGATHDAFIGRWLPLLAERYALGQHGSALRLLAKPTFLAPAITVAFAVLIRRHSGLPSSLLWPLAAFGAGGGLIYLGQGKGWDYHLIPLLGAAVVTGALTFVGLFGKLPSEARPGGRHDGATALAILLVIGAPLLAWHQHARLEALIPSGLRGMVETYSQPGDPVFVISTQVTPAEPTLLLTGRRPASRYLYLFPAAFFYPPEDRRPLPDGSFPYRHVDEMPPEEKRFIQELVSDLRTNRPPIVIADVSEHTPPLPPPFQVLDYLVHSGALNEVMSSYRVVEVVDGFSVMIDVEATPPSTLPSPSGG